MGARGLEAAAGTGRGPAAARPARQPIRSQTGWALVALGLLLFFDEVQWGMGRTGRLFAYEWADVVPDIMALAKGLGGGFPIGACLATERAATGMTPGTHGSTFGGNPLAMAIANTVLDVMLEDGFLPQVRRVAGALPELFAERIMRLRSLPRSPVPRL